MCNTGPSGMHYSRKYIVQLNTYQYLIKYILCCGQTFLPCSCHGKAPPAKSTAPGANSLQQYAKMGREGQDQAEAAERDATEPDSEFESLPASGMWD